MQNIELLGKIIKEILKSHGFTQELLSEKVGIDAKHLSRIECGKNRPSIELIYKISSVLKVEPCVFFQNAHLQEKEALIEQINSILTNCSIEDIRMFYKILSSITN